MSVKNSRNNPAIIPLDYLKKYQSIRNKIDKLCRRLAKEHKEHLACKPGCTQCCMDFSLFPVEFYSILQETAGDEVVINTDADQSACPFLLEGLCSIYESRPIICRTHGLPLIFMGEEEWQLSVCELNFSGKDIPEFSEANTFPQDLFNSELFMLNRKFINQTKELGFGETELLSLKRMAQGMGRRAQVD